MESLTKDKKVAHHRSHILRCMWPSLQLCAMLEQEKIIEATHRERFTQEIYSREEAVDKIMQCIYQRPDSAWDAFLHCLEKDEQKDLVRYLRGEVKEDLWPTDEIIKHRTSVLQQLQYTARLENCLISQGVLDKSDKDWLSNATRTEQQRTNYVLNILETKRPSAWKNFLTCLLHDKQDELAQELDPKLFKDILDLKSERQPSYMDRPSAVKATLSKLKFHAQQMNLVIMPNDAEGQESLCHAIADQLNKYPKKTQEYDSSDVNKILSTCKGDPSQHISNTSKMNIGILDYNGNISYVYPAEESKDYTLLLGDLGEGEYVSLIEKDEGPIMQKMKRILRERYIRWFSNATQPGCEHFDQPMEMDLRKTHVEVEICSKSKKAKVRRKEKLEEGNHRIPEDEMFLSHMDQGEPRSVLLEGESGAGKTTFVQRWLYEWATQTGSSFLHKISLPIVINARHVEGDIVECIKSTFPQEYTEDIFSYIKEHQELCLLIVDALDESDNNKIQGCLKDFLSGRSLPGVKVLVTSRTEQAKSYEKDFDRLVILHGIDENKVQFFIERYLTYFHNMTSKQIEEKIILMYEKIPMAKLRNPLACSLLLNISNDQVIPSDLTLCNLYREFVDCLLNRCWLEESKKKYFLQPLQSFALWTLIINENFDENDLNRFGISLKPVCAASKRILDSFIQTKYFVKGHEEIKELKFVHQQMLEYLAAEALQELRSYNQKMAIIALLALKGSLDCLRFFMTRTADFKDIRKNAYLVFITWYMYMMPLDTYAQLGTNCDEENCLPLTALIENILLVVVRLKEQIVQVNTMKEFDNLLKSTPPINLVLLENWINHSCEYEWAKMISQDLEFVGELCFQFIEYIFTDQPGYHTYEYPNIHQRILPLEKW